MKGRRRRRRLRVRDSEAGRRAVLEVFLARIVQRDTLRARKAGSHAWQASAAEEEMLMASKVFVGNLDFNTTRDEVEALFAQVGTVRDVFLPTDRESGRPRGFAFVEFESDEDAAKAIEKFNGHDLGGRALRVNAAEDRPPRAGGAGARRSFGGGGGAGRRGGGFNGGGRGGGFARWGGPWGRGAV